ncbi:MAG: hypothetical protein RLW62_03770, partial [Gammaproteobacteria bacterium]
MNATTAARARFGLRADTARPLVCVQGLGYVGAAMAIATASARDATGEPCFDVIGVERDDARGRARAAALHGGHFPYATSDGALMAAAAA